MADYPLLWKTPGPVVYRMFCKAGNLLYIGSTGDLNRRMFHHRQSTNLPTWELINLFWWRDTAEQYPTLAEARAAEKAAIKAERPLLNQTHNPTRWRRAGCGGKYEPTPETVAAIEALSPVTFEDHQRAVSEAYHRLAERHPPFAQAMDQLTAPKNPATTHPSQVAVRLPSHGQSLG